MSSDAVRYGHSAFDDEPLANGTMEAGIIYGHILDNNPPLKYFFVAVLILQSIFGTCGNLLIIGAVFAIDALRHTGNFFIINLAIADLCITAVAQPSNVFGALYGESFFAPRQAYCSAVSTLCATGCLSSCWNMMMISINRYTLICKWPYYEKIYTKINTGLMCLLCWIIIYSIESPNHLGWGDLRYSNVFYLCTFANHVHSYALFYILVGVATPLTITFIMYLQIYVRVKNSKMTRSMILSGANAPVAPVSAGNTSGATTASGTQSTSSAPTTAAEQSMLASVTQKFQEDLKIIYALFRVYLIFMLMWAPLVLLILIGHPEDEEQRLHHGWYITSLIIAHGNSSINCLVYAYTIDHFRAGYSKLLGCQSKTKLSRVRSRRQTGTESFKRRKAMPDEMFSGVPVTSNALLLSTESSSLRTEASSVFVRSPVTEISPLAESVETRSRLFTESSCIAVKRDS
ncbi:melatonin receptor type 1B-like [Paramacrobiotus metropolitanus]|uniref:melatonin receptor type 1B-like n=1 Tax=Paramacrobiotus metropolitanus TaxID=2943436 RepID=UPI002445B15E|nr:melatonin receptor type 1B-like [Paramacrobiotus metropolitanus]